MKILLVDDDVFLRDMYATKFTEHEHEVVSADSPVAALQQLDATQDFDVILLDMIMPGMSGVELVKEIKDKYKTFKGKCIILSNQGQTEDVDAAKAAGADGYIIKAESIPSDVIAKIEKIVADK